MIAFEMAERCDPESSSIENSLGSAYAALGKTADAKIHLEQALHLDPVNLSAADQLIVLYEKDGETLKADMLRNNLGSLFH